MVCLIYLWLKHFLIDIEDQVSKLKKTYAEMMQRPISSTVQLIKQKR